MDPIWRWPIAHQQFPSASAGPLSFVGGAGDFDAVGTIRNPGDLDAQIEGALANVAAALAGEGCGFADVVRFKAFYTGEMDDWPIIAALARAAPDDPIPAISTLPVPHQPFAGQRVQIQAIAQRGWRAFDDVRVADRPVPPAYRDLFGGQAVTGGLRAGEFLTLSNRTAADETDTIAAPGDAQAQSHVIQETHENTLAGSAPRCRTASRWRATTTATPPVSGRRSRRPEPHESESPGRAGRSCPATRSIPRVPRPRSSIWAFGRAGTASINTSRATIAGPSGYGTGPIPLPYRQGQRLRGTIWTGGQVPWPPYSNTGAWRYPGDLVAQTQFVLSYVADILRGFERGFADLKLLTCYFTSDGSPDETHRFIDTVAGTLGCALPPMTLVPQPYMHDPGATVEIWGIAQD